MPNWYDSNLSFIINDGEHSKQAIDDDEELLRGAKVHRQVREILLVYREVGSKRDSSMNLL